jgi:parallel beta-helix repeat protein
MRTSSLLMSLFLCVLTLVIFPTQASAQGQLSVSPTSISAQANVGASVPSQTVNISNSGNGPLKWSISTPTASWLSVSPTSGTGSNQVTVSFASTLAAGTYSASFEVSTNQSAITVNVQVTINSTGSTPPPSNDWTFCANEGGTCSFSGTQPVRYGANGSYVYLTLTGGTACTNAVFGDPAYGVAKHCDIGSTSTTSWTVCANEGGYCSFAGTQQVRYGANGSYVYLTLTGGTACTNAVFGDPAYGVAKQCAIGGTSTTTTTTSPPTSTSAYGPQSTITCPAGAVDIWPGQSIPLIVNSWPGSTTFCLRAGVHSLIGSITPKTGNTFVGEYGAVLDGSNWSTSDATQAAFRAHNQDIDYVTIRNLVIKNMPQQGIHAYYWMSDHWTIEYNEIASNKWGLEFGANFTIRNNYIHHNVGNTASSNPAERGGGYVGDQADNTIFDSNEIAYNGREQKVGRSANVTFRNNFVHHNVGDGIWYDSNPSAGALIDGNRVEDNGRNGIFFEASIGGTIRNNTVRRHGWDAVMISMSQNVQIYTNTLEGNYGGIDYFLNCDVLSGGDDVKNNAAYDNTVVVGTQSYAYGSTLSTTSSCTSTQVAPYLNGSKNLTFSRNAYRVPSVTGRYWLWTGWKFWTEWQAMGQDAGGSLTQ